MSVSTSVSGSETSTLAGHCGSAAKSRTSSYKKCGNPDHPNHLNFTCTLADAFGEIWMAQMFKYNAAPAALGDFPGEFTPLGLDAPGLDNQNVANSSSFPLQGLDITKTLAVLRLAGARLRKASGRQQNWFLCSMVGGATVSEIARKVGA
ncbi:hypothetical protein LTR08_002961 [Meristemomyces frigidus]|nr:hypothetical protein LTR08_002961 [Meristemomyces frigidus]